MLHPPSPGTGSSRSSLGVLIARPPTHRRYHRGLRVAAAAVARGDAVYVYLLDEGVLGNGDPAWADLRTRGLRLFACAEALRRRDLPLGGPATPAGLGMLNDLIVHATRFVAFT